MAITRESGESSSRDLLIVMPTTKPWGKVEVGLGFGNSELFENSEPTSQECLQKNQKDILSRTRDILIFV